MEAVHGWEWEQATYRDCTEHRRELREPTQSRRARRRRREWRRPWGGSTPAVRAAVRGPPMPRGRGSARDRGRRAGLDQDPGRGAEAAAPEHPRPRRAAHHPPTRPLRGARGSTGSDRQFPRRLRVRPVDGPQSAAVPAAPAGGRPSPDRSAGNRPLPSPQAPAPIVNAATRAGHKTWDSCPRRGDGGFVGRPGQPKLVTGPTAIP
jgi:hypothetical protein